MAQGLEEAGSKIRQFYSRRRRMPSYSEMQALFGFKSKNAVFKIVGLLVNKGLVEKDEKGRLLPGAACGHIRVLGAISAGFPSPAEEELMDTMRLDEYLVSNPHATYLLKVDGDSMIDAGIRPGDLVLVQRNLTPRSGDIVVAEVDNEWTLKIFEKRGNDVVLRAANKKYPVITPKSRLVIAGVAIANVRKYR